MFVDLEKNNFLLLERFAASLPPSPSYTKPLSISAVFLNLPMGISQCLAVGREPETLAVAPD